ncbi:MAG: peptide chain release factor N(5)-glutamine methyltransferase [Gammaproteobacteria bacterium]
MTAPAQLSPRLPNTATISQALEYAEQHLLQRLPELFQERAAGRAEARALLRLAARCGDARIYAYPDEVLPEPELECFRGLVERRGAGEPLAYLAGTRGFHAIDLHVDARVLVPRPETELIVEAVFDLASTAPFSLADLGTGSGAIALAVANRRADATITGIDISPAALAVASRNATALGHDIEWIESDWFSGLGPRRFDFVCCNPPYVRTHDAHFAQLGHEPRIALDGGPDGLTEIRRVLERAADFLEPAGTVLLEHGYDQARDVARIGGGAGLRLQRVIRDLGGHPRVSQFGSRA